MPTLMKLSRRGKRSLPTEHFSALLHDIQTILTESVSDGQSLADEFACRYLSVNIVRKQANLVGFSRLSEQEKSENTLKGFLDQERRNNKFNRTQLFGFDAYTGNYESDLLGVNLLYEVRELIRIIIGDRPNLGRVLRGASFGNGASATLARSRAQDTEKYLGGLSVTKNLFPLIRDFISHSPSWSKNVQSSDPVLYINSSGSPQISESSVSIVSASVYDEVEKDAEINRTILKEPEYNGYVQKGIGKELRRLLALELKSHGLPGVSLNTSGHENALLAKEGSVTGLWATVDAKRASDSITLALCEFLLPPMWYDLLCKARTPYVLINKQLMGLDMMSGMGNGFTFELESLIFYAIGFVCAKRSTIPFAEQAVNIHGDDLIIPSDVFALVRECYTTAGVTINEEKSFASGPFRESCGGHYFNGVSVKPFYVKKQNGVNRGDWFWLANSLLIWLSERDPSFDSDPIAVRLKTIYKHTTWYASSGKPEMWRVPVDYSRRAGLYSKPPQLHRRSHWKTRMMRDRAVYDTSTDDGRYVRWLDMDERLPTVLDMCQKHDVSVNPWDHASETCEDEVWVKLTAWADFTLRLDPVSMGVGFKQNGDP